MAKTLSYFFLGAILWVIVDFTTTEAIRDPVLYYSTYMPALLIFYLGYPLVFSILIYKLKLGNVSLFFATLLGMIVVEVLFTHNAALFTFPLLLIAIPAGIAIYSLLTFLPKWILEREVRANIGKTLVMLAFYLVITAATVFGSS